MSKRTEARGKKITIQFYTREDAVIRGIAKTENRSVSNMVRLLALKAATAMVKT